MKSRHLIQLIIAGLLLGFIPYLVAWNATPEGNVFFGTTVNVDDIKAYLSAIQQGREGYWLFNYNFTPEQYDPQLMYIPYMLVGKLAGLFGGSNLFWMHASRLVFGVFTFITFKFWVESLFPESKIRQRTAWILISFGSGFAMFVIMFGWDPENLPLDLITPELTTITNLISSPHYILAVGLLALYFGALLRFEQDANPWKWTLIASITGLGIGLTYPYQIPMVGLVTGLWLVVIAIRQKKIPMEKWGQGAVILTPLTIILAYYALIARQDALWEATFVANHGRPSPHPWALFLGLGLLAVFGFCAIIGEVKDIKNSKLLLPILWALANLFVIYLPIPFALRLVLGFHIPLATLAASFFETALMSRIEQSKFARSVFLGLSASATVLFVIFVTTLVLENDSYPYYYPEADLQAVDWLAAQVGDDDVTLANYHIGGYLPTVANTKVFMGQFAITVDYEEKIALVDEFWDKDTSQSWRENFVEEWGIEYIFQGSYEAVLTGEQLLLPWEIIYQENGVTIYSTD